MVLESERERTSERARERESARERERERERERDVTWKQRGELLKLRLPQPKSKIARRRETVEIHLPKRDS